MKKLKFLLGSGFMALILTISLFSCTNNGAGAHPKDDTIYIPNATFRVQAPDKKWSGLFADSVVLVAYSKYVLKDSATGSGGHWVTDTFAFGRIYSGDTLRLPNGKPIIDSAGHPRRAFMYWPIQKGFWTKLSFSLDTVPHLVTK